MVPCWQEIKRIRMFLQEGGFYDKEVKNTEHSVRRKCVFLCSTLNSVAEAKYFDKLHTLYSDPTVTIGVTLGGGGNGANAPPPTLFYLRNLF